MRKPPTYAWQCCCVALLIQLPLVATAGAGVPTEALRARPSTVVRLPSELWAVQIGGAAERLARSEVQMLRSRGVNTLVLDRRSLGKGQRTAISGLGRRAGLLVLEPVQSAGFASRRMLARTCGIIRRSGSPCAVEARSPQEALALARGRAVDLVVVRLGRIAALRSLRGTTGRVVALLAVDARSAPGERAWTKAIDLVRQEPHLDLGLASPRSAPSARLRAWSSLLDRRLRTPAASRFVAGTGSDSNPCTRTAPCASFNRAYKLAKPGQVVEVAAGNYPEQVITPDESKTSSADVVFQPAPGATVQVGTYGNPAIGIDVRGASHLTVKGIKAGYVEATFSDQYCCAFGPDSHFASDVTFDSMTVNAAYVSSGQQVTIQNSDIGNYSVADDGIHLGTAIRITSATSSSQYPAPIVSYLTLKNNLIHNLVHPSGVATHAACLYFANAFSQHITITGNKFTHCAIIDLELGPSDDVTVENNWFDLPTLADDACCSLQTIALDTGPGDPSTVLSNVRIAYNSFKGWITTNADTYTNVAVEHNVWESPRGCFYGGNRVTYSRNVKGGPDAVKCGPTDILAPTGWPNDSGPYSNAVFDFHLKAGAAAIDAGDRRGAPKRDIDGNRRPFGRAPDAGADERTK
jgi:hypothetical protein